VFRTALAKLNHRRIIRLGKLNLSWGRTNSNRSKLDSNRISIELNGANVAPLGYFGPFEDNL